MKAMFAGSFARVKDIHASSRRLLTLSAAGNYIRPGRSRC